MFGDHALFMYKTIFGIIPLFDTYFNGIIPVFDTCFDGIIPFLTPYFDGIIPLFDAYFDGIIPLPYFFIISSTALMSWVS